MDEHKIPRLAEASIQYKPSVPLDEMPVIRSADDVVKLVIGGWEEIYGRETVKALLLTSNNMVLGEKVITSKLEEDAEYTPALSDGYAVRGIRTIGIGGISNTSVDIKTALQAAMLGNAVGMILVHNHPSGSMTPSKADVDVTSRMKRACEACDLELIDHVIISPDGRFYSFADDCNII